MDQRIRVMLAVLAGGVAAVSAARSCRTVYTTEAQKRLEIEENMNLDLKAIRAAADVVHDRIERGEIRSLTDLGNSLQTEIAFHKIAIREI